MTVSWPIDTLIPAKITRHIAPRTIAGTVSASGFTQRVSAPAHAWVIEYSGIPIKNVETLLAWDATEALLDGGSRAVLVYLVGESTQVFPNGVISADADAGATSVSIQRDIPILAGYHFSLFDRLHRVAEVVSVVGNVYEVNIRPPLRVDVSNGGEAAFETLVCKCRLATDDEMTLEIDSARRGFGNVKFVEDPSE